MREEKKVEKLFYKNSLFKKLDISLKKVYFKKNPYAICKSFMEKSHKEEVHVYGETPLTELYAILQKARLQEKDHFVDLGCGRGRNTFFAAALFSCKATGIDIVPTFIKEAEKIASFSPLDLTFLCEDILSSDLSLATVIYFYALCLDEDLLLSMVKKLSTLKAGTKIITVSFPLTDYLEGFHVLSSYEATYPWGKTELFINEIKKLPSAT